MENVFPEVKKKLGFGCMRLPLKGEEIDYDAFSKMIDVFLENGFNYFDTAHMYMDGRSENALKRCLTSRYPRDQYILTDKLSGPYFDKEEDILPFFEKQLLACGVTYFDFYLMHSQNKALFEKYKRCRAYETAIELKKQGKIRHLGISFHDTAQVLEEILTEYPQIEVVQIQFNYLDYEDAGVQSRLCYEVCRKFGKPVIIMEPVKGGKLAALCPEAAAVFDTLQGGGSPASYAIRFAAGFEGVMMVLSGMSNMEQALDNINILNDFKPLSERELAAIAKVCEIIKAQNMISCTACRYCTEGCPKQIRIPDLFHCMNTKMAFPSWNIENQYRNIFTKDGSKASDCIQCGKCEEICPQHLPVRKLLKEVAAVFDV